jgi:tRNA pseudouridine32 synthase/23S rRNA pseudouridine746 synthase
MLDFFAERFPAIARETWHERMAQGLVVDEHGVTVTAQRPYRGHLRVYYYRAVPAEPRIPFDEVVLYQDAHLVVADKPHFLPVVPSGNYLRETLLLRLKNKLSLPDPVQPQDRAAYSALFSQRQVNKCYEAIAPWRAELALPLTRESRIVEAGHFMLQHEASGVPNAITQIELIAQHGALAHYRLHPVTGKRHQLRVHMAALGVPIVGDGLYPTLTPEGQLDYAQPLQLLARSIEFTDPVTGKPRHFESQRKLKLAPAAT